MVAPARHPTIISERHIDKCFVDRNSYVVSKMFLHHKDKLRLIDAWVPRTLSILGDLDLERHVERAAFSISTPGRYQGRA